MSVLVVVCVVLRVMGNLLFGLFDPASKVGANELSESQGISLVGKLEIEAIRLIHDIEDPLQDLMLE